MKQNVMTHEIACHYPNEHKLHLHALCTPRAHLLAWPASEASRPKLFLRPRPPLTHFCCITATSHPRATLLLDNSVKCLYFYETMDSTPPYGSLATRFAALQQRLSSSFEGGLTPHPPAASGSLALRTDNKVLSSKRPPILIGASKTQPADMLEAAICLGLADFGENKVQEAYAKWPALKAKHPQVRLHLIGPLQSNKAAEAVALFDVIQTIDRIKIADALAAACEKQGLFSDSGRVGAMAAPSHEQQRSGGEQRGGDTPPVLKAPPKFLIQVNTGEEPQKAGVAPREAAALLAHCRSLGLNVVGLMCVPPEGENPAPHFALLKKMANTLGLSELSMGMSGDFETAIRLGSTMVRVGTALFGSRL